MRNLAITALVRLFLVTHWRPLWQFAVRLHKGRPAHVVVRMEGKKGLL